MVYETIPRYLGRMNHPLFNLNNQGPFPFFQDVNNLSRLERKPSPSLRGSLVSSPIDASANRDSKDSRTAGR